MAESSQSVKLLYFLILVLAITRKVHAGEYGILFANTSSESGRFCVIYFKEFYSLPATKADEEYSQLVDTQDNDFCTKMDTHNLKDLKNKFVLTNLHNCSLNEKARNAKELGCKGVLVVTPPGNVGYITVNATDAEGLNITVALISESSVKRLSEMGTNITVQMSPTTVSFDFSLLIIWIVAVFTLAVGAYWSGIVRQSLHNSEVGKLPHTEITDQSTPNKAEQSIEEESTLNVSPILIAFFVLCMGGMLLLLYFFFEYLVYVIIGLFVIASILSVCSCLDPLIQKFSCTFCHLEETKVYSPRCWLNLRFILVLIFAISLSVTWVVLRKESYSWILQDVLGVCFIINMLKSIRLPSLKICTLLLVLLFFYDIFFVFITPFLTEKGKSIMVEVATGGSSNEQLPMVLRVPHLRLDPSTVCTEEYSILGFGDILVPGLLVSYCHGIDMFLNKKKIYYITTCVSYGFGLIATFFGLYLMSTAQPALLYLVPATLLPLFIIGKCRGDLSLLWHGVKVGKPQGDSIENNDVTAAAIDPASTTRVGSNGDSMITVGTAENPKPFKNQQGSLTSEGTIDNSEEKFLLHTDGSK